MEEHIFTVIALLGGFVTHIIKKVVEKRTKDKEFHVKDYVLGAPYQTALAFAAAIGGYLTLHTTGSLDISSAFLAGIAANSFGDVAPGER